MGLQGDLDEGDGRATSAGPAPDHNATNPSLQTNPHKNAQGHPGS